MFRGCVYTRRHDYYSFGYMVRRVIYYFDRFNEHRVDESLKDLANELQDLENEKIDPDVLIQRIHMLHILD